MNRTATLVLVSALLGCSPAPEPTVYGPYPDKPASLRLPDGRTLAVYRMKVWTFPNGEPPALQLEYEAPFSVEDTAAVHRLAVDLWSLFLGYVDTLRLSAAIVTATNRVHWHFLWYRASHRSSFGIVAARGTDGVWRFQDYPESLPPREQPFVNRVTTATGEPFPIAAAQPTP